MPLIRLPTPAKFPYPLRKNRPFCPPPKSISHLGEENSSQISDCTSSHRSSFAGLFWLLPPFLFYFPQRNFPLSSMDTDGPNDSPGRELSLSSSFFFSSRCSFWTSFPFPLSSNKQPCLSSRSIDKNFYHTLLLSRTDPPSPRSNRLSLPLCLFKVLPGSGTSA